MFKANLPFLVLAELLIPSSETVKGVLQKKYIKADDIFISFRTFGGTVTESNGQTIVQNTAVVQTWYREDIKSDCRLSVNGIPYEIMGTPENINMMNQYLQFKVQAVKGGA